MSTLGVRAMSVFAAAATVVAFAVVPASADPPTQQSRLNKDVTKTCKHLRGDIFINSDNTGYECDGVDQSTQVEPLFTELATQCNVWGGAFYSGVGLSGNWYLCS